MRATLRIQHFVLPLAVAGLLALAGILGWLRPIRDAAYDGLLLLRKPAAVLPGILLLDVDDGAASLGGPWPWPRSILADGLVTLREMDARSVLLELPLSQPSAPGLDPAALRQELPSALTREFTQIEENVQSLFDAIRRGSVQPKDSARYVTDLVGLVAMAKVRLSNAATGIERDDDALLGQATGYFGATFVPLVLSAAPAPVPDPGDQDLARYALTVSVPGRDPSHPAASLLPPVLPVFRGSRGGGFTMTPRGDDPVLRAVPPVARVGGRHYAHIALAALLDYLGGPGVELRDRELVLHGATLPDHPSVDIAIPLGDDGGVLLDWPRVSPGDGFRHLSWAELIRYGNAEAGLVSALREMDAYGWLSYLRSDTPLLGAYESASRRQREMLAAGTSSYAEEWKSARDLFFSLCDQYLNGDAQARILADEARAADSPALSEEERQSIRALGLKVPGAFGAARSSFSALKRLRDMLKQTVPGSLVIVSRAGSLADSPGFTPYGAAASAGALAAALMNTILERRFTTPVPALYAVLLAAVLSLLLGIVLHRRHPLEVFVAGIGLAVVTAAVLGGIFVIGSVFIEPVLPVAACAATGIALAISALGSTRARGRSLRAAFAGHVSSGTLARLLATPGLLARQGRRRDCSVLSVAIRGLAGAAMPKDPESAARALRAWHAGLIEAVFTQDGMVMGVSGDAFTACFGVLDDDADSVMRACRAAIRMKAIGQELGGGVLAQLAIRIGIDTGPCIVGDLSARGAARWSVAGSPTDLASRLQALTTRYGTTILASGAVREIAASAFLLRSLDTLRVEGTGVTVQVFDLFAEREGADEVTVQMIARFEEGRERFERRDWQGALALFGRVLALRQSDGPAALFAERCRQLAADPDRPISFPAW